MRERLLGEKRYVPYKDPFIIILIVLIVLLVLRIIFISRYCLIYVVGDSMSPTLTGAERDGVPGGDYLYADTYANPEHGDIVAVNRPGESGSYLIKRVVALGGDTIYMDCGVVYVMYAGTDEYVMLEEDYVAPENNDPMLDYNSFSAVYVPQGYMFLLGDNRGYIINGQEIHSIDSRVYGCFSEDEQLLGVITDWSLKHKSFLTSVYSFFNFGVVG